MTTSNRILVFSLSCILLLTSCDKDPLIETINPLTTIVNTGTALDLDINDNQIVYNNSKGELVVMNRRTNAKKFYHKFNSHVSNVGKIQKSQDGHILISDNTSGIFYFMYDTADFIVRSGNIIGFDDQRQYCYRDGLMFRVTRSNGLVSQWNTWNFRFQDNAQTCMLAFNDTLWLGTKRNGLFYVDINDYTPRSISQDYQGNYENVQLLVDDDDNLWSLTSKYLTVRKEGKWSIYRLPAAMTATDIVVHNEVAYISSDKGVYRFNDGQITEVAEINDNLRHNFVTCLSLEKNNTLWLGTGAGIYTYPLQ